MLEDKLIQAQKLEALGILAGGIAHDYNNLLMGIQGRASLMLIDALPGTDADEHLRQIEKHVESASSLTRQLLAFAREGKSETKAVSFNGLIEEHHAMFCRTHREITFHQKLERDLWTVEADNGQMRQVLMNIYVNACQAMPDGGELHVQTSNVVLEEKLAAPHNVSSGRYVQISVADTGTGIAPEILPKIFDPFFTTKGKSRGTGLGLASVYGIVKNHSGFVSVESQIGQGARFDIFLPASVKKSNAAKTGIGGFAKGTGTILLIDDEEIVLDVGSQMLQALGYSVLAAPGGGEGIRVFESKKNSIDLVIIDMVMPAMDGGKVFDEIKKLSPQVKAILASGFSLNEKAEGIMRRGCDGFIQKPFNLERLSRKLEAVMS